MKYEIEKGISIPRSQAGGATPKYPFRDMEIGDSFFVRCIKSETEKVRSRLVGTTRNYHPMKFTARLINTDDSLGIRIWRIQ